MFRLLGKPTKWQNVRCLLWFCLCNSLIMSWLHGAVE
jgi:hypothetical protein